MASVSTRGVTGRRIVRVTQIALVVLWYAAATGPRALWQRMIHGKHEGWSELGRGLGDCMWRLGPTFVKFGQLWSTRPDLLHPGLCAQMERSLVLRMAVCRKDDERELVNRGSVADVHHAWVAGSEVAVKRLRPGVDGSLEADLDLLMTGARLLSRIPRHAVPVEAIVV